MDHPVPHGGGLFPVHDEGDVIGSEGPWFNWKGRRIECSWTDWDCPDGRRMHIGLTVCCPQCEYPFLLSQLRQDHYGMGDDGELSLAFPLTCPGFWHRRSEDGHVLADASGRPQLVKCGWVGVVRQGVAHHPRCQALHQPGCQAPAGAQCACQTSRWGGIQDCNCRAVGGQ